MLVVKCNLSSPYRLCLSLQFYMAPGCRHDGIIMRCWDTAGEGNVMETQGYVLIECYFLCKKYRATFGFRAASFFLVMSYTCWTVWSGKLKHPSGSKTSSSLSDEGGGNLRCAPEIPIKDYTGVIGGLAYFLPSYTSLYFFSQSICSGLLVLEKCGGRKEGRDEGAARRLFDSWRIRFFC